MAPQLTNWALILPAASNNMILFLKNVVCGAHNVRNVPFILSFFCWLMMVCIYSAMRLGFSFSGIDLPFLLFSGPRLFFFIIFREIVDADRDPQEAIIISSNFKLSFLCLRPCWPSGRCIGAKSGWVETYESRKKELRSQQGIIQGFPTLLITFPYLAIVLNSDWGLMSHLRNCVILSS